MFKELINLWKGKESFMGEIVKDFSQMLEIAETTFRSTSGPLFGGNASSTDLVKEIYRKDAQLNSLEQTIRRKIVELLSARSDEPIASCMILMSIAKDAERLGDYSKNILSVFQEKPAIRGGQPYYDRLHAMQKSICNAYADVRSAYRQSDSTAARRVVERIYADKKACDTNVNELLVATPQENYVAYAVLFRFFKRILAHLGNIATSIFMPVTHLDFFDEIVEK